MNIYCKQYLYKNKRYEDYSKICAGCLPLNAVKTENFYTSAWNYMCES